jgi:ribosomal protein S18 acetylase RimI-like enzyme
MHTLPNLRIERADPTHLQAVTALAQRWQIDTRADNKISSQGFLMAGWQLNDYQTFLDEAEYFFVAIHNDTELAGFSVAYSQRHAHLDPWLHRELAQHLDLDEYMLWEQLCIAPEWARRGVGTRLLHHLLLQYGSQVPVIDELARSPLNQASVNLHKKFGFAPLIDLTRPSGILTTIWMKRDGQLRQL